MNKQQAGQRAALTRKSTARTVAALTKVGTGRPAIEKAKIVRRVDGEARHAMVAQAAYFRAEKRGFANGGDVNDWLEAEREIARMLDG